MNRNACSSFFVFDSAVAVKEEQGEGYFDPEYSLRRVEWVFAADCLLAAAAAADYKLIEIVSAVFDVLAEKFANFSDPGAGSRRGNSKIARPIFSTLRATVASRLSGKEKQSRVDSKQAEY